MSCQHMNFNAGVKVARLEGKKFMAEVRVTCTECGKPMQFLGLETGFSFTKPTVTLDGLEVNLPMVPEGLQPNPFQLLQGTDVKGFN